MPPRGDVAHARSGSRAGKVPCRRFNASTARHCGGESISPFTDRPVGEIRGNEGDKTARAVEELAAKLLATARKLPPGPDRHEILQDADNCSARCHFTTSASGQKARNFS